MAKPSTRQGLIDYCLRKLGAPVLEINVDDDQIDDLVDDAIQYFNERHFDGVERMFLKYKTGNIRACAARIKTKNSMSRCKYHCKQTVLYSTAKAAHTTKMCLSTCNRPSMQSD